MPPGGPAISVRVRVRFRVRLRVMLRLRVMVRVRVRVRVRLPPSAPWGSYQQQQGNAASSTGGDHSYRGDPEHHPNPNGHFEEK